MMSVRVGGWGAPNTIFVIWTTSHLLSHSYTLWSNAQLNTIDVVRARTFVLFDCYVWYNIMQIFYLINGNNSNSKTDYNYTFARLRKSEPSIYCETQTHEFYRCIRFARIVFTHWFLVTAARVRYTCLRLRCVRVAYFYSLTISLRCDLGFSLGVVSADICTRVQSEFASS